MKSFTPISKLLCVAMAMGLSACDSNKSESEAQSIALPLASEVPQVNGATVFEGHLNAPGGVSFERFLKIGLYTNSIDGRDTAVVATPEVNSDSANGVGSFSQTNTVESGVDEADRIKYDGDYMYVAQMPQYFIDSTNSPTIRVLKRNDDFSLSAQAELSPSLDYERIDGMYLHEDRLAVIGTDEFAYTNSMFAPGYLYGSENKISISVFDVSEPEQARETNALEIEGDIVGSRRIDNDVYIVSRYVPTVDDIVFNANTEDDMLANYNKIASTPVAELMPKLIADGQEIALNDPEDCYFPAQSTEIDGYAQLITVTKIDLSSPSNVQSICMSVNVAMLYMSANNLYFAGMLDYATANRKTQFHKIDLSRFEYSASGSVAGELGWRSNAAFRLHEHNDTLRVVTSNYFGVGPEHSLHILEQEGQDLVSIATLPNETQPEAIGKPNEEIYAVRFSGDKAYIVTFERTDPLYVINLSDSANPYIEGSLEIPGFSSYIHVLDNNYLLGIGQEFELTNLPAVGSDLDSLFVLPQSLGMKISLFDVGDPSQPIELSSLVYANTYTIAEYDYKALSVLNSQGQYQFAIPTERWVADESSEFIYYPENSLLLLSTDTNDSIPSLQAEQQVSAANNPTTYYYGSSFDRSIIHGDKVYYLHGDLVWLSTWGDDTQVLGPY